MSAGGGSGGHVTPALAVLRELNRLDPKLKAYFVTDRQFAAQASEIMSKAPFKVQIKRIYAGKFRRYHNVGWFRQLIDIPTLALNLRDLFLVGVGFLQSFVFLLRVKPDAVFTKGGFVCLPLGLAARVLRIPLAIHDSDSHPGLTNRILAKHATIIGTGAPVSMYPYNKKITRYIGIPIDPELGPVTKKQQRELKAALGLHDTNKPLLVVTGGGLGARNINHAITSIASQILPHMAILHITGAQKYQETVTAAPEHIDYIIKPFLPGLSKALGAADLVLTRAGATSLAELEALAKPTIIVPHANLTGGHQLKNAQMLQEAKAAIVMDDSSIMLNPQRLLRIILALAQSEEKRNLLSSKIHAFAKPDAALNMAALIVDAVTTKTKG